ncbi:hypothetical protein FZEAL_4907, partial [Fusarium zealandicum]
YKDEAYSWQAVSLAREHVQLCNTLQTDRKPQLVLGPGTYITPFPDSRTTTSMSEFDPSVLKAGEDRTSVEETENEVSLAYGMAMSELDIILELIRLVQTPPGDDFEALKIYRDMVVKDVRRLDMKVNISKQYLKARDAQFHYRAKRLRTGDRIDRLRLWDREKKQELEASRLRHGDRAYERVLHRYEEEKRVMIKCYKLEGLWEKAVRREESTKSEGDDLSSDCETSMEE